MSEQKTIRSLVGIVTSDKMDKTITVAVARKERHPVYGKYVKRTTKLHVHDPKGQAGMGDTVMIQATRKLAKTKSWELVKIMEKAIEPMD